MFRRHSQLIIGLINQGANIFTPFLITIVGLKYISASMGSLWLIFLSMIVLINLLDFGLSPTIIRNVSYVIGGAKSLAKTGVNSIDVGTQYKIDYGLLKRLVIDVRKIYRALTLFGMIIIIGLGTPYFYYIAPATDKLQVIISWCIFSCGLLMSLYYLYYTPLLCGFGVIQNAYKANIIGRFFWLFFTGIVILIGPSLVYFSSAFFASVVINRIAIKIFYDKNKHAKEITKIIPDENSTIPFIAHNAVKLGTVSLGSFLISRATVLIAGAFLPLIIAGQYTFSLQVYMALLAVGNVFIAVKIPELSQLVLQKDNERIRKLVVRILSFSLMLYFIGFSTFYLSQEYIIKIFNAKVGFLRGDLLIILAVIYFLELTHSICATILTTANKIPFVKPALISGIMIVIISFFLMKYTSIGILGLILAQGIVQLAYNNWKWPLCVYRDYWNANKK